MAHRRAPVQTHIEKQCATIPGKEIRKLHFQHLYITKFVICTFAPHSYIRKFASIPCPTEVIQAGLFVPLVIRTARYSYT